MMFYMGGQYVYKALVPLLFVVVLTDKCGDKRLFRVLRMIVFTGLVFVTSLSSGSYVFLCGLLPVMACSIVYMIINPEIAFRKQALISIIISTITTVLGIMVAKAGGVVSKAGSIKLKRIEAVFNGSFGTVESFVELFRPLGSEFYDIGSMQSILYLSRMMLLIVILLFGLAMLPKVFGISTYKNIVDNIVK